MKMNDIFEGITREEAKRRAASLKKLGKILKILHED